MVTSVPRGTCVPCRCSGSSPAVPSWIGPSTVPVSPSLRRADVERASPRNSADEVGNGHEVGALAHDDLHVDAVRRPSCRWPGWSPIDLPGGVRVGELRRRRGVTLKPAPSSVGLGLRRTSAPRHVGDLHRRVALAHDERDRRVRRDLRCPTVGSTPITCAAATRCRRTRVGRSPTPKPAAASASGVGLRSCHDVGDRDERRTRRDDEVHVVAVGERPARGRLLTITVPDRARASPRRPSTPKPGLVDLRARSLASSG